MSILDAIRHEQGPQGAGAKRWKALTFIPKFLNAQDIFFGSMIEAGEIARLTQKGVPANEAKGIAKELSNKYLYRVPITSQRDKSANYFNQALDGVASLLEQGRTTSNPFISWPMKFAVPFLRTPIRIAQFSVESSPLAFVGPRMTLDNIAQAKYGKSFDKLTQFEQTSVSVDRQNRVGLASIGTMVALAGVGAAIQGDTTWGAPQDERAKRLFYASGRRPYSFRVGDKWFPLMYLGPFFVAYAIPAAARDAFADNPRAVNEGALTKLALAASGIPKIILSQTPVSGVNGLVEAMQGKLDKSVKASVGFQLGQFVPTSGLLRWMTKITDPVYRRPVSVFDTIQSGIPGLSQDLNAHVDETGADASRPWTDVYLPYTVGQDDLIKGQMLQARNKSLKIQIRVLQEQRERAQAARDAERK
jgi:hypothetical protein